MGIVRFYSWLKNKDYRGVLIRRVPQYVSSFCFDFNGIIHDVAQLVYAYGKHENLARRKLIEKADPQMLEAEFYQALATKLAEIIASVQPRETLVIAVDGVAPQAKIAQQRKRRFRSIKDSTGKMIFNSSAITPGTEFMKRLDNFLQRWIISSSKTLPPKVIYSSHMVDGEAEHKVFSMFRNGEVSGNGTHVVYGMDADLIMLSLLSPLNKIYLMREDVSDVIDIDNLKIGLKEELPSPTSIEDFVVMIYLIGNDFLPHLPALGDMEEAINTLMRTYNRNQKSLTKTENGEAEIDWVGLLSYLQELGKEEPRLLELESIKDVKYPSRMMEVATKKTQVMGSGGKVTHQSVFDPNIFRAAWYENVFKLKGPRAREIFEKLIPKESRRSLNSQIVEIVKDYLTGISWVYRYYAVGKDEVNNDYVYRNLFAPLISDIAFVAAKFVPKKEDYMLNPDSVQINPVHQLLSVLPPQSKDLLPEEVRHLANSNSLIGDYFPEDELLERDGANTDWEGTLLINMVDMERIIEAVEKTSLFSAERIIEFSPVHNIVLMKDPAVIALDERTRKFKEYLQKETRGRGSGRGRGQSGRGRGGQSGRGQSGRGQSGRGQSGGRGYSGRGRGSQTGGRGRQEKIATPPRRAPSAKPVQKFEL